MGGGEGATFTNGTCAYKNRKGETGGAALPSLSVVEEAKGRLTPPALPLLPRFWRLPRRSASRAAGSAGGQPPPPPPPPRQSRRLSCIPPGRPSTSPIGRRAGQLRLPARRLFFTTHVPLPSSLSVEARSGHPGAAAA